MLDPAVNEPVVVVEVGGLLGLNRREFVIPYSEVNVTEGQAVLDSDGDGLDGREEYDEGNYVDLPADMVR